MVDEWHPYGAANEVVEAPMCVEDIFDCFRRWSTLKRVDKRTCPNDTDGDGNCHKCARVGRCFLRPV